MSLDLVAFFAHPDDETMLCGGTLALLASRGVRVHLLIATRGEGGEMGEPPLCEREALGAVREEELRCAANALGAASLTLMDYIDPTVGPDNTLFAFTEDIEALSEKVVRELRRWNAAALLSHGVNGEYGHPAHKVIYQAAKAAVEQMAPDQPLFYTVQGLFPSHPHPWLANSDAPAHMVLDIDAALQEKTRAALCHRTQHALFTRKASEEAARKLTVPEVIQRVESLHRVLPVVNTGKIHDPLADLLWESGSASLPAME